MAVGALLGVLGLLLLASSVNSQQSLTFTEDDYTVVEGNPQGRMIQIDKTGTNVGIINVTFAFLTLQEFRDQGMSEDPFDTSNLDTADINNPIKTADDFRPSLPSMIFEPSSDIEFIMFAAPIDDDDIHELDEGFFIFARFSFAEGADLDAFENNIQRGVALIRIRNDDNIDFELERIDFMLPEDSGNTDIIIRKSVGTRTEVELTVMLDFDILNDMVIQRDEDFTLDLPMSFTFSSTDEVMSITLTVIDDNLLEVTESFAVSLFKDISIPDVNINPDRGIATVEIIDDEIIVFGFDETEIRVQEGAGSVSVGLVVFSPDPMLVSDGFIRAGGAYFTDVTTSDGTAVADADYLAFSDSVILGFEGLAGRWGISLPVVTILVEDDDVVEEEEEFTVNLAQGLVLGDRDIVFRSPNLSRVIIVDNDANPSTIGFLQDVHNVSEGDGFVEMCVAILTPADLSLLMTDYVADLTVSFVDVTAVDPEDYDGTQQPLSLTPAAPEFCFTVAIEDDDIVEVQEYFRASLEADGMLPQEASLILTDARVNIDDNDEGRVGFFIENVTVTEGTDDFAVLRIGFLSPGSFSVETFADIQVTTTDGTADDVTDYEPISGSITVRGGGQESVDVIVPIRDDNRVEDPESLSVVFEVLSSSGNIIFDPTRATVIILDDDEPVPVLLGLEQSLYMTSENEAFVQICASIMDPGTLMPLTPAELATLDPIFVADLTFSVSPITALEDVDYSLFLSNFSLTPNMPLDCFDVPIIDDSIFELTEYFNASLDLNGPLPLGALLGITRARVRLIDNEVAVIGLLNVSFTVDESQGSIRAYYGFISPDEISEDIVINVDLGAVDVTAFGGSDFDSVNVQATLQGRRMEISFIDIVIIDDTIVERPESENFEVVLSSSNSSLMDDGRFTIAPDTAVVIIIDNDVISRVGFERPEYNTSEDDGSVEICAAIMEPADTSLLPADYTATFNLSLENGFAIAGLDFESFTTIFSLSPTMSRQCFDITINDDSVLETIEDFFGRLVLQDPPPPNIILDILRTRINIADNEEAIITFESFGVEVFESDGEVELIVLIQSPPGISSAAFIDLSLETADNTAIEDSDYRGLRRNFRLTSTENRANFLVDIIDDNIQEIPIRENFTASLMVLDSNVAYRVDRDVAYATIIDDDDPLDIVIGYRPREYNVTEGDAVVTVCASILQPANLSLLMPSFEASVLFSVIPGTAMDPDDYTQSGPTTLFFSAATPMQCVDVPIVDDDALEPTESFTAMLTPDGTLPAGVRLTPDEANILIFDNEVPSVIGYEESLYVVGEGDGFVEICVIIQEPEDPTTLNSDYEARVEVSTIDGSATAPPDFFSVLEEFTLTPDNPRACFNVTVEDDDILETDEYFNTTLVGINLPPAAVFNITSATVLLEDNELGCIGLLNETVSVQEDAGMVTVCVGFLKPDEISEDISVEITFFTTDGSAQAGQDYNETQATFTLVGGVRQIMCQISIPILPDLDIEGDENFITNIVNSSSLPPRVSLDPDRGMVIIIDVPPLPTLTMVSPPVSPTATDIPTPVVPMTPTPVIRMGGDPHYSIMLPSGQLLCFSVHGEKNFPFNLITNDLLQMNAFFIEDALREEITWIGSLGVVVQHTHYKKSNTTKIRFEAKEQMIYINNGVSLHAEKVERLTLANGKLTIAEALRKRGETKPEVEVDLVDAGLHFTVRFAKKRHLDMSWKRVMLQPANSHGLIGQFLRKGVEIDETRKLLYLPSMEPVPVMRSSVWHFMERDRPDPEQKLCWQTMNPGYQGKRLIEGSYLDYLVDDVLSSDFKFKPTSNE